MCAICELLQECALKMVLVYSIVVQFKFWSGSNRFHIWMSQRFRLRGMKSPETTVSTAQFHLSVSFSDLKWLRGLKLSFEKQKQINRGDPRKFIFDISTRKLLFHRHATNIYSRMLFFIFWLCEVISNFGDFKRDAVLLAVCCF